MVTFQEDLPPPKSRKCDCSACTICKFFCREPQFILKVMLIVVNIIIVMTIIAGNSVKLNSSVHATLTSLRVKHYLHYPAVTICQHPALRYTNTSTNKVRTRSVNRSRRPGNVIADAQLNKHTSNIGNRSSTLLGNKV